MTTRSLFLKIAASGIAFGGIVLVAIATATRAEDAPSPERGRYLVSAMGCHDCHTPWTHGANGPAPDMTRMLSGHPAGVVMLEPKLHPGQWAGAPTNTAFKGPWGTSFTANLTPDETGLASWTEEMFVRAIREGRHMGQARPILPPMPWAMIRNLNDVDLKSIFAYLRTIPPIQNRVPEPLPPASAQ